MDERIFTNPRRGSEYLVQIPKDISKYHPEQVIRIKDDEGAS